MKPYLVVVVLLLLFSSCARHYYPSAMFQNDVQYMAKPHSSDSVLHGTYASGAFLTTFNTGNISESGAAGLLNVYRSHTLKHPDLSVSYGVLGFAGNYYGHMADNPDGLNKSFYGLGANFSISPYIKGENVDWHIIGLDLVYTKEFGDYAAFRQKGINTENYIFYRKTDLFTYGIFTEAIAKVSPKVALAFKIGLNNTPGEMKYVSELPFDNVGFNAAATIKRLTVGLGYKFMPTDVWLSPSAAQISAAYRF